MVDTIEIKLKKAIKRGNVLKAQNELLKAQLNQVLASQNFASFPTQKTEPAFADSPPF